MKKSYFALIVLLFLSVFYFSCSNKNNPVIGNGGNEGKVTTTYKKTTPPVYMASGNNYDYVFVNDTGSISTLIYNLDTILSVDVTKLDILLTHNGTTDTLVHNLNNPGTGFLGTSFSDGATNSIQNGSGTYTGTFKPYKPLSVFNGANLSGEWQLLINYWGTNKTGVIKSWNLTITYNRATIGNNIFPFTVGNNWIFKDSTYGGTVTYDTMEIPGSSTLRGKQVYWWKWKQSSTTYYVRGEDDGIYDFGNNFDTTYSPNLWFKYPVNVNESYLSKHWFTYTGTDTITCMSTNITFGNFTECIQYSDHTTALSLDKAFAIMCANNILKDKPLTSYSGYFYFKPGIGYVGAEIYSSGILLTRLYCVSYNLY